MDLQTLQSRKSQLDVDITNMENTYKILMGHKNECEFWIQKLIEKEASENQNETKVAIKEDEPVE